MRMSEFLCCVSNHLLSTFDLVWWKERSEPSHARPRCYQIHMHIALSHNSRTYKYSGLQTTAHTKLHARALWIASPTPFADAGFWPVISLPSTMTLSPHGSAAFSYVPPSSLILSSTKKGMSCRETSGQAILLRFENHHGSTLTFATCSSSTLEKQAGLPSPLTWPTVSSVSTVPVKLGNQRL